MFCWGRRECSESSTFTSEWIINWMGEEHHLQLPELMVECREVNEMTAIGGKGESLVCADYLAVKLVLNLLVWYRSLTNDRGKR